ncbi:hypothetical protein [Streptomyces sp. enrichment culture]|uniref:hypothetical protein n=1 Tax=Streptomyces sp. enrichment culture TaxID=1795815 RepID=UPI003F57A560
MTVILSLVTAFVVGGLILINDHLSPLEKSASRYLGHLSESDGRAACSIMTRKAQADLMATYRTDSCGAAVHELLDPLTTAEIKQLAQTDTGSLRTSGRQGYVSLDDNPLDLSQLVFTNVDNEWLLNELQ